MTVEGDLAPSDENEDLTFTEDYYWCLLWLLVLSDRSTELLTSMLVFSFLQLDASNKNSFWSDNKI